MSKNKTGRNEPCPCKSGLKYKYCHGDVAKLEACKEVMNRHMADLIIEEKIKRGLLSPEDVVEMNESEETTGQPRIIMP